VVLEPYFAEHKDLEKKNCSLTPFGRFMGKERKRREKKPKESRRGKPTEGEVRTIMEESWCRGRVRKPIEGL